MCGIAGILSNDPSEVNLSRLKKMTDVIAHRGPDGEGQWLSPDGHIALGHRRLSIIDLSHEADQPMHYLDRYTIVFNGEIYNYIELKEVLLKQGFGFHTASDTEVLMALYHRDKEACLQLLDGMFSFAIYDSLEKTVFCARDRFGEKPFFYSYIPGKYFMFGSEMKCLWAGGVQKNVNNRMLYNYMAYGLLENQQDLSETFYENCTRLPHSHFIKVELETCTISIQKYYDINWKKTDNSISEQKACEIFEELFYTSVKRRLRSDVPVGSSLSGGLDSSLVVCVIDELKKGTRQKQTTFSAVFPGFKKDERKYMDLVLDKTFAESFFTTPDDEGFLRDFDNLCYHQEEPFGSASIYAQYCVMRLARENKVTVLLDGQGADEILAGYHSYYPHYFNELRKNNWKLYQKERQAYQDLHKDNDINQVITSGIKNKVKMYGGRATSGIRKLYQDYSQVKDPMFDKHFYREYRSKAFNRTYHFESLNDSLYQSTFCWGLQELLRYADRNSMAHSREVRLPFLSHELVEFLFTLPSGFKIREGWTKWIMRKTFDHLLPAEITWRKDKIGYEPPQKNWMENSVIKERTHEYKKKLFEQRIISENCYSKEIIAEDAHHSTHSTWRLYMAGQIL